MGIPRKRLFFGVAFAAILPFVLSACVSSTAMPSSSPIAIETPTASATPTVAGAQPTLPLKCSDIFTDEAATAIVGAPLKLVVTETTLRGIDSIAERQAGLLNCIWGGTTRTDNGWDDHLELTVLPDAAADYDTGVMKVDDGAVVYTAGTLSEYLCGANSWCRANLLVDNYWVHAEMDAGFSGGTDKSAAEAGARALLDRMAGVVRSTIARPAWTTPSGVLSGNYCAPSDLSSYTDSLTSYPAELHTIAFLRAAPVHCGEVTIVPGGAWALPLMTETAPKVSYMLDPLAETSIPGMDSAVAACGNGGGCLAIGSIGGSAVEIAGYDITTMPEFLTYASAKAAEIRAAG